MSFVNRTVKLSKCYGQQVTEYGDFADFYSELEGFYSPQKATRKLRRMFGNQSITINRVEHYECAYRMGTPEFLTYAQCVGQKQVN